MPNQLKNIASLGRYGDTMLAHINPQEAALLKSMGGAGTVNPQTGLREFYGLGQFQFLPQITPEPLPSLGQAIAPESLKNLSTKLNEVTVQPPAGFSGFGGIAQKQAYQEIAPEYSQYADKDYTRPMSGINITGYTIPSDQTFQGKPLVAKYDPKGNFQHLTVAGGDYLVPDPNQPNIVAAPKINAKGEIVDYGVFDLNQQDSGGFGDFIGGLISDFGPMILAGLGANLAAGNLGSLFGGGAAAGGATAADIAASNALAAANTAGYAGTSLASTAAGAGLGASTLADLAAGGGVAGGATAADIAAHEALAAANTAGGLTAADVAAAGAAAGGANAADIAAHEALASANTAGGLTPANVAAAAGAGGAGLLSSLGSVGSGLGSSLSSILGSGTGLGSLIAGAGNVASGVISGNAAKDAAQIQADAAIKAAQIQQDMFNTVNAQGAPYRASGYNALNQIGGMLPGQYNKYDASGKLIGTDTGTGYLTQQYGPEQFQKDIDPGYAFRLQQGQMANQRASNLAGGLIGGNALRGMQDYTQGMASQEYGNAFNRFQTQRGNIYNTLASIAGIGQTAQGQANTLAQNNATAQGQLGVGSAAATAAGKVGQATGYGNALTGAGNAILLSQLLGQNQGVAGNLGGSNFMNAYNNIG